MPCINSWPALLRRNLRQEAGSQAAKIEELGRQLKAAARKQAQLEAEVADLHGKLEEAAATRAELEVGTLGNPAPMLSPLRACLLV
jgi:cell division protein FtsB